MSTYEVGAWAACGLFGAFLFGLWFVVLTLLQYVMKPRVFISYRRKDRPTIAGLIRDRLRAEYGEENVAFDIVMKEGEDYREGLIGWLRSSNVVVAIVGPNWDGREGYPRPRIFDRRDWVHMEMSHAIEARKKVIVVRVKELNDGTEDPPTFPDYANVEENFPAWNVSPEELAGIEWLRDLRCQTALEISLTAKGKLEGIDRLLSRISARWRDRGWLSLFAWKWVGGPVVLALALLVAIVGNRVAQDAAAVRPLDERAKTDTTALAADTKKVTDELTERADRTKETLARLDGVYINPTPLEQFIEQVDKDNAPGGDLTRYRYHYVCWHMKFSIAASTPDRDRKYWVKFIPFGTLPPGVPTLTIRAVFDEDEFNQQVKDKKREASMHVSGRIHNVDKTEIVLEKCRVAVGRATEPPRKNP